MNRTSTPTAPALDRATLGATVRAFLRIREAGMMQALRDELTLAAQEYRQRADERWQARVVAPLVAMDLAKLIAQPRATCEEATYSVLCENWPNTAAATIIDFARRMRVPSRRRATK